MQHEPDDETSRLHQSVLRSLAACVPGGAPLIVGYSGGRDSAVLLDALATLGPPLGHAVSAVHVHHGLSANAGHWAQFCVKRCAQLGVACMVRRVDVPQAPSTSLEAEARHVRYDALAQAARELGASVVVVALAHHRNDQAETLLLQLLRGAGPHGLAAMPTLREDAAGNLWWRPLLDLPRTAIDAYARGRGLAWIDDESNADHRHARNAVRNVVFPALTTVARQAETTLARAAAHQAEAARLLDELAAQDAVGAYAQGTLQRDALDALSAHRARNLLRWFLRSNGLPAPSTARLAAMLDQLRDARGDAQIRLRHAGVEIGVHQGRIALHPPEPLRFDVPWSGEPELSLAHGTLVFAHVDGAGIDEQRLAGIDVRIRSREGGERFQLTPDRPRRALKAILRDAGIPAWERHGLPLVWCGDALAAVAGVGIDAAFRAAPAQPGVTIAWHPKA